MPARSKAGTEPIPSREHLERYAELLVGYALGGGEGIREGDVVSVSAPDCAKPLYVALCRAVWKAGGHVIGIYLPADDQEHSALRDFYELASDAQLDFFPERYRHALLDQSDHMVHVRSVVDPNALSGVDPAKLMRQRRSLRPLVQWQSEKENAGKFTWTVAIYGTEEMAAEAGLSADEYWRQIIDACFLDDEQPAARWREVNARITSLADQMSALPADRFHVRGEDVDLWITQGERRRWIGGGGRNIPSFEVFTSPDWRGTEGRIRFSEPLYAYGSLIKGIELQFEAGRVVKASAETNERLLGELLATDGADRVGEFSLTDSRLSPITRFMADTLFDENVGGPFGNTHIAIGNSLHHCYDGDPEPVSGAEWERLGFNESVLHTDIVSTTDRTVTAVLSDGSERVIYAGGRFTLDEA